jgi:site-specific DNA-methyltransferase (adenine-specific)
MQFDVIVGNPPYQLNDGGGKGTSAGPIYDQFVDKSIALAPRFLSVVIPARWYSGGKGLDGFRERMLNDRRIRAIEDFPDASDVFPGVQIKGGVCFFLWNRDNEGDAVITTHDKGQILSTMERPLLEPGADVLIRYNEAVALVKRVFALEGQEDHLAYPPGKGFAELVSVRNPYSLGSNFPGLPPNKRGDVAVFRVGSATTMSLQQVEKSTDSISKWKVFIPFLASGSDSFPHSILGKPFVGPPNTVCTESYLLVGPLTSENEALNVISYINTRFFRFLVLQKKPSQNATKKVYEFVPVQDFSRPWTDEDLYSKYKVTAEEIAFIESMIRPMGPNDA